MKQDGWASSFHTILRVLPLLVMLSGAPAHSHSVYSHWETASGMSCCNQNDCRTVDEIDIRFAEHGLQVRVEGEWVTVKPESIRPYLAPDLNSHVCHIGKNILCFVFGGGA